MYRSPLYTHIVCLFSLFSLFYYSFALFIYYVLFVCMHCIHIFQCIYLHICVCVCVCACICGESSSRILLLQSETHCFDWADKLARSPQSAIFPPVSTHSLSSIFTPSIPPFPPSSSASLCALRTAGQGDSDEVHISVNQNVD